ncbi:MAG: ArnT family glycosyltransferase [Prevotella sp.]
MQNSHRQLIIGTIFLFTVVQYIILVFFGYTPYPDSNGYWILAQEAVNQCQPYPTINQIDNLAFVWNVGAINITALSLYLFHSITPVLYFYTIIKGLTAALVYLIALRLFNNKAAYLALLIYILYPANYGESTSLLSETPFIFFALAGVYATLQNNSVCGGLFIAIANWFRPMGIVFIATLAISCFINRQYKRIIHLIIGYILMIGVIGSLSYIRTGYFIYQAKTGWMALLQYSVDHTADTEDDKLMLTNTTNPIEKDKIWQKNCINWIAEHPLDYLTMMPEKFINTYISDNVNMCTFIPDKKEREYMYQPVSMKSLLSDFPHFTAVQWLTVYNLLYYYALIIMFIISLCYVNLKKIIIPIGIIGICTLVLLMFGHGEARFHIPLMPFIIMTAAYWITSKIRV